MDSLLNDIRLAFRTLARARGVTLLAILTLAIGTAATTSVFSVMNDLLFRPLAVSDPGAIVNVHRTSRAEGGFHSFSYPDFTDLRDVADALTGLAAWSVVSTNVSDQAGADRAFGMVVSGNYFDVLGVRPALGRFFLPEEDSVPGGRAVVVLGHHFWQRRFGGDPAMLGRAIRLEGHPFTVIGIAPRDFNSTLGPVAAAFFVPVTMDEQVGGSNRLRTGRGSTWLELVGRRKPGVSRAAAEARLSAQAAQLAAAHPGEYGAEQVRLTDARGAAGEAHGMVARFLAILLALAGLVLAIASVNVANLLLAHAMERRREIAIRIAIGASRARLLRQLLTETVLLFLLGAGAGVLLTMWTTDLLMRFRPPIDVPLTLNFAVDGRVLAFTLVVALATALIFGLAPALQATRPDVLPSLKAEAATSGRGRLRLRNALVTVQVAVSLVLLVAAGLFLRSLRNAAAIDPGFRADNLLLASFDLSARKYDTPERRIQFRNDFTTRLAALPGVHGVSAANLVPLGFGNQSRAIWIEGQAAGPDSGRVAADFNLVAPGYFATLEIAVTRGREFTNGDARGGQLVVIVNETLAHRFWPGQDALGKRLSTQGASGPFAEVVGVARDGKYRTLGEAPRPYIYTPLLQPSALRYSRSQGTPGGLTVHVRTTGDPATLAAAVRREARALDPDLPLFDVRTMREHLGLGLLPIRVAGTLLGAFGFVGLVLAAAGIYGVTAYSVSRRTREVGIRMALGARPKDVRTLVVRQGMVPALVGLGMGSLIAVMATRLLRSLLYDVSPTDALTFAVTVAVLGGAALLACYLPARRASRVDPMTALRYE